MSASSSELPPVPTPRASTTRPAGGRRPWARRFTATTAAAALGLGLLAGCGGSGDGDTASDQTQSSSATSAVSTPAPARPGTAAPTTAASPAPDATSAPGSTFTTRIVETPDSLLTGGTALPAGYTVTPPGTAIVAQATVPAVSVYKGPADVKPFTTLKNPLPSGAPLTFLVDGQTPTRAQVLLPIRPNGSTGWVNLSEVRQLRNDYKLVVRLSEFRIQAFKGDTQLLETKIGIGTSETPTPGGRYYIKELLRPPNPDTVYGVYAYGLSGFSPVLTKFNGGEGVLGIHGTNRPDLLGQRVSKGCIRMRNEDITKLARLLPLGTPVIVET